MSKWTREQIIRELLRREAAGLPLVHTKKPGQGVESALYSAGVRIFGSWRSAVMAAGIAPELGQYYEQWSVSKVLGIIRILAQRRCRLRPEEIQRRYGNVDEAARRYFGSWPKAIVAAGIDPAKILRVVPWTGERIIEAILTRVLHGKPLGSRSVAPQSLADAAVRIFGSWDSALVAAGLEPMLYANDQPHACGLNQGDDHPRAVGVPAQACRQRSQDERGGPLQNPQPPQSRADRPPERKSKMPTPWTNQGVLDAITSRQLAQQAMDATSVYRENKSLFRAATWRHGTWRNALLAAGLNPDEFPKSQKVSPAH
jgi:hypothetical protein